MVTEGGIPKGIDKRATLSKSGDKARRKPLTTVIGVYCNEGILLFADTQETTGDVKQLDKQKIFLLNKNRYAIACSGDSSNIDRFVTYLKSRIGEDEKTYSYDELYTKLHKITMDFVAEVKDEVRSISMNNAIIEFDFAAILAAPVKRDDDRQYGMYRISIYNIDSEKPVASHVSQLSFRACVGSGHEVATSMLNAVDDFAIRHGSRISNFNARLVALICTQIVNLVSGTKTSSGPTTNASLTDAAGSKRFQLTIELRTFKMQIVADALQAIPQLRKLGIELLQDLISKDKNLLSDLVKSNKRLFMELGNEMLESLGLEIKEIEENKATSSNSSSDEKLA